MRPLTSRERLIGALAGAALIVACVDSWHAMAQRAGLAAMVEAEVELLEARLRRAPTGAAMDQAGSIREIVQELAADSVRVVESRGRWTIAWRGDGPQTWARMARLSRIRDAALATLSIRNTGGLLDAEVVVEARRAP